ncbi:MAG TPA: hypothetical protein V6D17_13825, partial [Candidatus Obscuribacterales bacterium]
MAPAESVEFNSPIPSQAEWWEKNLINPFLNAACIEPCNAVTGTFAAISGRKRSDKLPSLEIGAAKPYSADYWLQNLGGAAGSLIPYAIAGRLAGKYMCFLGARANVTGRAARVIASEWAGQIVGATCYEAMKDPRENETRYLNAASAATAFTIFESSNALSKRMPLSLRLAIRLTAGAGGSLAQEAVAHAPRWLASKVPDGDELARIAVTGAVMNAALPAAQEATRIANDRANRFLGLGVSVSRYLETSHSEEEVHAYRAALDRLLGENPWARVQPSKHGPCYDSGRDLVYLPAKSKLSLLLHELQHRSDAKTRRFEPGFQLAARLLKANHESAAWSVYRSVRLQQELAARLAENGLEFHKTAARTKNSWLAEIPKTTTFEGKTYFRRWREEFAEFKKKKGAYRPKQDFAVVSGEKLLSKHRSHLIKLTSQNEPEIHDLLKSVEDRSDISALDIARIYQNAALMIAGIPRAPLERQPRKLATQILGLVADPYGVVQGDHPMCGPASLEFIIYTRNPVSASKLVSDVARRGSYTTSDGTKIILNKYTLLPEGRWYRSYANQLFQNTAANIYWQRQDTFRRWLDDRTYADKKTGVPGFLRYERVYSDSKDSPYRLLDYSTKPPRPVITDGKGIEDFDIADPYMTLSSLEDINRQIQGAHVREVVLPDGLYFDELETALRSHKATAN